MHSRRCQFIRDNWIIRIQGTELGSNASTEYSKQQQQCDAARGFIFIAVFIQPEIYAINYKDRYGNKFSLNRLSDCHTAHKNPIARRAGDIIHAKPYASWRCVDAVSVLDRVRVCPVEMPRQSFNVNCPSQSVSIFFFVVRHQTNRSTGQLIYLRIFFFTFRIQQIQIYVLIMLNIRTTRAYRGMKQIEWI